MDRRTFVTLMGLGWLASASPMVIGTLIAKAQPQPKAQAQSNSLDPVVFYIATNGNDAWTGKLETPNSSQTDGPFATLARGRYAIRELKRQQGGYLKQPVTVFLRGGTYFLNEPLEFTPQDTGSPKCPIIYAAYKEEKPVISGGRRITDWKQETVNGRQLWVAKLPEVQDGKWFFRQLWVNGQRRTRARYPNKSYLKVAELPDVTPQTQWKEGQTRFKYEEGDLRNWNTLNQAEVVVMTIWVESRLPVTSVDESQRIINFGKRSVFRLASGSPYYIENALEILDTPGEWYLDKKAGKLYYLPMPNEQMTEVEVIAPVLDYLVKFQGNQAANQFIDSYYFRGLTFSHAEWELPDDLSGFGQAAAGVPGVIDCTGIINSSWQNCQIAHVSSYGIRLYNGCYRNRILSCAFFDLGAGGVLVRNGTHSTEIKNCSIYDCGRIFHSAAGIIIHDSYNNNISRNHIYDLYYTGISIGWVWGYGASKSRNNIVEYNHIHHIGKLSNGDGPILNELAGIYTLSQQPGTIIRYNLIHHITALGSGGLGGAASGIGLFLDEGTSYVVIENNIVYETDISFHHHYGRDNIVRNNIFAFGSAAQISRIRPEPNLSFTFERNIVCWRDGKLLAGRWADTNFAFDRNLYWGLAGGEIRFGNLSFDQWRAKGQDKNSIIADPLFVAPESGNFQLKPNSPAFRLGFQPIPLQRTVTERFSI